MTLTAPRGPTNPLLNHRANFRKDFSDRFRGNYSNDLKTFFKTAFLFSGEWKPMGVDSHLHLAGSSANAYLGQKAIFQTAGSYPPVNQIIPHWHDNFHSSTSHVQQNYKPFPGGNDGNSFGVSGTASGSGGHNSYSGSAGASSNHHGNLLSSPEKFQKIKSSSMLSPPPPPPPLPPPPPAVAFGKKPGYRKPQKSKFKFPQDKRKRPNGSGNLHSGFGNYFGHSVGSLGSSTHLNFVANENFGSGNSILDGTLKQGNRGLTFVGHGHHSPSGGNSGNLHHSSGNNKPSGHFHHSGASGGSSGHLQVGSGSRPSGHFYQSSGSGLSGHLHHASGSVGPSGHFHHSSGSGGLSGQISHASGSVGPSGHFHYFSGSGGLSGHLKHGSGSGRPSGHFHHSKGSGGSSGLLNHASGGGSSGHFYQSSGNGGSSGQLHNSGVGGSSGHLHHDSGSGGTSVPSNYASGLGGSYGYFGSESSLGHLIHTGESAGSKYQHYYGSGGGVSPVLLKYGSGSGSLPGGSFGLFKYGFQGPGSYGLLNYAIGSNGLSDQLYHSGGIGIGGNSVSSELLNPGSGSGGASGSFHYGSAQGEPSGNLHTGSGSEGSSEQSYQSSESGTSFEYQSVGSGSGGSSASLKYNSENGGPGLINYDGASGGSLGLLNYASGSNSISGLINYASESAGSIGIHGHVNQGGNIEGSGFTQSQNNIGDFRGQSLTSGLLQYSGTGELSNALHQSDKIKDQLSNPDFLRGSVSGELSNNLPVETPNSGYDESGGNLGHSASANVLIYDSGTGGSSTVNQVRGADTGKDNESSNEVDLVPPLPGSFVHQSLATTTNLHSESSPQVSSGQAGALAFSGGDLIFGPSVFLTSHGGLTGGDPHALGSSEESAATNLVSPTAVEYVSGPGIGAETIISGSVVSNIDQTGGTTQAEIPQPAVVTTHLNPAQGEQEKPIPNYSALSSQGTREGNSLQDSAFISSQLQPNFVLQAHGVLDDLTSSSTFTCGKNHDHNTNYHTATFQVADNDYPSSVDIIKYHGDAAVLVRSDIAPFQNEIYPEKKNFDGAEDLAENDNSGEIITRSAQETQTSEKDVTQLAKKKPEARSYHEETPKSRNLSPASPDSAQFNSDDRKFQTDVFESSTSRDKSDEIQPEIEKKSEEDEVSQQQKSFKASAQDDTYSVSYEDGEKAVKQNPIQNTNEATIQMQEQNQNDETSIDSDPTIQVLYKKPQIKYPIRPAKPKYFQKTPKNLIQPKSPLHLPPTQKSNIQNHSGQESGRERLSPPGEIISLKIPHQHFNNQRYPFPRKGVRVSRPRDNFQMEPSNGNYMKLPRSYVHQKAVAPIRYRKIERTSPNIIRVVRS